jgi:hypothetical protein
MSRLDVSQRAMESSSVFRGRSQAAEVSGTEHTSIAFPTQLENRAD